MKDLFKELHPKESTCKGRMIPYPRNLTHGDYVALIFVNDGRGFEDLYDEYHLEFSSKIKEI